MKPSGAYRDDHNSEGPFFFIHQIIEQNRDITNAWTMFILDKSNGTTSTQSGAERINESIRVYVWAIIGPQAQTHTNILTIGT